MVNFNTFSMETGTNARNFKSECNWTCWIDDRFCQKQLSMLSLGLPISNMVTIRIFMEIIDNEVPRIQRLMLIYRRFPLKYLTNNRKSNVLTKLKIRFRNQYIQAFRLSVCVCMELKVFGWKIQNLTNVIFIYLWHFTK